MKDKKKRILSKASALLTLFAMLTLLVAPAITQGAEGKKDGVTYVEVFENGNKVLSEEYTNPMDAWGRVLGVAKSDGGYHFPSFVERTRVELTLGSNFEHDMELVVQKNTYVVVDLNGHCIRRTRNGEQISKGGVFVVDDGAKLVIKDSNPDSEGYDGVKGGVICGGASTSGGGAIHMKKNTFVSMEGGTLYDCTTNEHGGAIMAADDARELSLKNCRIFYCQAVNARGKTHGGALYLDFIGKVLLENVLIDGCYAENNGGAIYVDNRFNTLSMKNVVFSGNKAEDHGGAIMISKIDSVYNANIRADGCIFAGNKAEGSGGAVYVDGRDQTHNNPTIFMNCLFESNETGNEGSAIFVNDKNVVLSDCIIQGNIAKNRGAVYVDSYYDIGVKGTVIIRDNQSQNYGDRKDLVLQDGVASKAYIFSGGLYKDSYISISSTGSSIQISPEMVGYQTRYLHPESGSLQFKATGTMETPVFFASAFTEGSVFVILFFSMVIAAAIVACILIVRYRKKAEFEKQEGEK